MSSISVLMDLLEIQYQALAKTGVSLARSDFQLIVNHINYLEAENKRLNTRLAFLENNSDNKIQWQ